MSSIWHRSGDEWLSLTPTGFANERKLHDLIGDSPNILPLAGDPSLCVLGQEVQLGSGRADLLAVQSDGRLVVMEIKLAKNSEARRAVVAQVLTYAAYLKGLTAQGLEDILRQHLHEREARSVVEAFRRSDQAGELEEAVLEEGLRLSLSTGHFRLVLVLDEAPSELVELVGYLESVAPEVQIDLIAVSAYDVGSERILVPQRIDPERPPEGVAARGQTTVGQSSGRREVDGSEAFATAIERAPSSYKADLERLLSWADTLEKRGLATLRTVFGHGREVLLVWVRGEKGGLVSIWNDSGAFVSLWRSVFVRLAWEHIAPIEHLTGKPMSQGTSIGAAPDNVLDALADAYEAAAQHGSPEWNGSDYYVAFGEGPSRNWDEARRWGFVSAGGGEWYSRTLRQLKKGNRVFVYIPRGSGVGGYVGVGEVRGEAVPARDFEVGTPPRSFLDVTSCEEAKAHPDDLEQTEWLVPVKWLRAVERSEAIADSDFFANQNSAVRMTHGYTLKRLRDEWELPE